MSKEMTVKCTVAVILIAAATLGSRQDALWPILGLLAFGLLNVFLSIRRTVWACAPTVVAIFVALLSPKDRALVVLLLWLFWPPAFLVTWALGREVPLVLDAEQLHDAMGGQRARAVVAGCIGSIAAATLMYRWIVGAGLQQTAALFVGIPALLAMGVALAVVPRSAVGVICKAVTIGLLVSAFFLGEGVVCVVMSAPLFYAIAVLIGLAYERASRGPDDTVRRTFSGLAVLAVIPMSLEGVTPTLSFDRDEWVTETKIVRATPDAVQRAILDPPRFDRTLPPYLRVFPRPIATRIERDTDGTRWIVRLRGGEMRIDGIEPRTGDLVLRLEESRPGFVRWRVIADGSHTTHFLDWREAIVQWEPAGPSNAGVTETRVTWTLRYRRGLDPAWYFGPWERYAAGLAAGYLIDAVATP